MRWLEAVAGVGQRSSNDHAHGVIHVRPLHFVFDVDGVLVCGEVGHIRQRRKCRVQECWQALSATCRTLRR